MRNKKGGMKLSEFYKIRRLSVLSLYSLVIILAIGFLLPFARTQVGVEALIDLTGDSTITMTSSKNSATVTIDPTMTGVFETTSGAGDIAFSVSTTNYTGYRLTARSTKTTLDKGVAGSFASLVSGVTAEQFGNANNTTLNNRWGYKPSFYNSEENTRYFGSSTTAVTLDQTSVANSTAKNYTISLGARADSLLPSGSYINDNFILEAVANTVPTAILTINYGPHVTGVTIGSTPVTNGETVKLIVGVSYPITMSTEANFSTPSWTATTGTIASASSASTTYIITSADATLTATGLFSGPNIQNLSDANCTTTASLAIDTRDERIYQVKRLEDGRCWMMENLDLGRTALTADLTSTNTNISSTLSYSTFNGWIKETGSWTVATGELIPVTGTDPVSNVPYGTLYNFYAASAGTISGYTNTNNAVNDICPAGWRMPTGGTDGEFAAVYAYHDSFNNMRAPESSGGLAYPLSGAFVQSAPQGAGSSGIYWASTVATSNLWTAAQFDVMMQELYITDTAEEPVVIEEPAVYLGDSDYRMLGVSIRCIRKKPTHTLTINYGTGVQAVYVNGDLIANSGTVTIEEGFPLPIKVLFNKNYDFNSWTATSGTIGSASEQFTTYTIGTSNATLTANGAIFTGNVIQNLEPENCTTTPAKYKDIRDNQVYTVKRLADGKCWMMENLNLGSTNLTVDLTSANSNLSTTVAASTFNSWITDSPTADYSAGVVVPVEGIELSSNIPKATYYNFYAASGGTISGSSNANNSTYDICPAGWRLPTGGSTGELGVITDAYIDYAMIRAPLALGGAAFGMTGGFNGTTVSPNGNGYYWSSTRSSNTNMRYLMTFSTGANDVSTVNRRTGSSIRCVLDQKAISDLTYMQDFAALSNGEKAEVATSMFEGQTYQLTDNRDSKVYEVAKLKDGRIWMAENLDLGATNLSVDLTSANTNITNTITASTFNGWKGGEEGNPSYTSGEYLMNSGTDSTSGNPYATLYNYHAATGGQITGASNTNDATQDICPAGWRLPTGGASGEYQNLYTYYNSANSMRAPIDNNGAAISLSGMYDYSSPVFEGSKGYYWTSTAWDQYKNNYFYLDANNVSPYSDHIYNRNAGLSIRCIVDNSKKISDMVYMQDFNNLNVNDYGSILNSMSYDTTYQIIDNRDNKTYAMAKLRDGNIWMTENLDFGRTAISTDLTSANTNLAATVSASTFNGWKVTSGTGTNATGEYYNVTGTDELNGTPYGTLYNYYAASVGTISGATSLTNASSDICPAGWRLPTGGPYGELLKLYNNASYNTPDKFRATVANGGAAFALAGVVWTGAPEYTTYFASYWSSTRQTDTLANRLSMNKTSVGADTSDNRTNLFSIRCIAKMKPKKITDYTYMQDLATLTDEMKSSVMSSMIATSTYGLIDIRDNKTYQVAKFKDDRIWMAENLDLGRTDISVNLNYTNTNMSTAISASVFNGWRKTSDSGTYTSGEYILQNGYDSTSMSSYGTQYNFYAASAGTISGEENTANATADICPLGWRLPTGGNNGEYRTLYLAYNSDYASIRAPVYSNGTAFSLAGVSNGSQGRWGYYFSSTARYETSMFGFVLDTTGVLSTGGVYRDGTASIRCIVK